MFFQEIVFAIIKEVSTTSLQSKMAEDTWTSLTAKLAKKSEFHYVNIHFIPLKAEIGTKYKEKL